MSSARSLSRSPGVRALQLRAEQAVDVPGLSLREALRAPFRPREPARRYGCERQGCGAQATTWHHWTAQRVLREFVMVWAAREARSRSVSPVEVRAVLRNLLRARRNLTPLCRSCHMALEAWRDGRGGRDGWRVPPDAVAFARELGPEWEMRLRRAYPAGVS